VSRVRKALVGAVGGLSAALAAGAQDGTLSAADWLTAAVAAVAAGWAVWVTPNAP
jgi:hypothetical protein